MSFSFLKSIFNGMVGEHESGGRGGVWILPRHPQECRAGASQRRGTRRVLLRAVDPHLLSGLHSQDFKSALCCSGVIHFLSSLDICSLPWKEEGLPEGLETCLFGQAPGFLCTHFG